MFHIDAVTVEKEVRIVRRNKVQLSFRNIVDVSAADIDPIDPFSLISRTMARRHVGMVLKIEDTIGIPGSCLQACSVCFSIDCEDINVEGTVAWSSANVQQAPFRVKNASLGVVNEHRDWIWIQARQVYEGEAPAAVDVGPVQRGAILVQKLKTSWRVKDQFSGSAQLLPINSECV